MRIQISHSTTYTYDREVRLLPHLLYLRPRETPLVRVESFNFTFMPQARLSWMQDDFDNMAASAQFDSDATSLEIRFECTVSTTDDPPFDFLVRDTAQSFPFDYEPLHQFNLSNYLMPPSEKVRAALRSWVNQRFIAKPNDTIAWLFALNQTVHHGLRYQRRDDQGIQPTLTTAQLGSGSCRDYAVFLVECARSFGLAARFVSGYLYDPAFDTDTSGDMHAWAEVFIPGAGWRGMDPTHGIFCTNAYVPVAQAVVAESVNPIQGSFRSDFPASSRMEFDVRVRQM